MMDEQAQGAQPEGGQPAQPTSPLDLIKQALGGQPEASTAQAEEAPKPPKAPKAPESYQCKSCGGVMVYAPETQSLRCQFCSSEVPIEHEDAPIEENDYELWAGKLAEFKQKANSSQGREGAEGEGGGEAFGNDSASMYTVTCKQCGASTSGNKETMAHNCPFCGTPLVIEEGQQDQFWTPNYVVPFAVGQHECTALFKKWIKGHWFAPGNVRKGVSIAGNMFKGVYLPYWTYDAHAECDYEGQRGEDEVDDEGKHYTEWYDVSGHLSTDFDDILVPAVSSIDRSILSSATDFDQTAYRPFQYAYLAGFVTQTYTIDFVEGSKDAEEIIKDTLTEDAEKDIGGAKAKVDSLDTQLSNRTFKLLVLPFWLATFQYNNKRYQVVVNGLSGTVYGKAPVSTAKVLFVVLIFVAIIALFIWL